MGQLLQQGVQAARLVGVVAAISAGGAGAVFWMWVTALVGSSTAFVEATLAQIYKEKDPLYGGWRGGPAYYIDRLFARGKGRKKRVQDQSGRRPERLNIEGQKPDDL